MLSRLKNFSLPEIEEKVLKFWRENQIFDKSLKQREKNKEFVFYEGPPTANGRPGIHHVLARVFKDIVLRYKTMTGFHVPRRSGWDTHGLPVELEVEKQLGLKSKKDIEKFGIAEFNRKCKESVWLYKDEWEKLTERIGFWLDLKNPYITYENSYIETLWWIFKQIWDKKLLYKSHKVVPWCSRCGTGLSSHELALGYKEVEDTSVFVKFKVKAKTAEWKNTSILSWTTTPWTLPGNLALAINPKIDYVKVKNGNEFLVLAKSRLEVFGSGYEITKEFKGKSLVGLSYESLFKIKPLVSKKSYKIYPADFVSTDEGTGVVHTAVMYGEDDYNLGKKVGLPQHHTVDERGKFTFDVPGFAGMYVKAKETEEKIIKHLQTSNYLLKTEKYTHEYPFCWRCSTPLLYYARDSWFIGMSKLRKQLLAENEKINWIPETIKHGRFGEWLREVKDWAISRERYWGTSLPIWECQKCENQKVIGSFEELSNLSSQSKNRYILVRHGEAESNLKKVNSNLPGKQKHHLTLRGRTQVEKSARDLQKDKIDLIFSSDLTRCAETAEIFADSLGIKKITFDKRLREINMGKLNGRSNKEYQEFYSSDAEKFVKATPEGETLTDLRTRVFDFVGEFEKNHKNRTILIVSHEYSIWMLYGVFRGLSNEDLLREKHRRGKDFINFAGLERLQFRNLPRDLSGQMDPHRPFVDDIYLKCDKCGSKMRRVKEVADAWFDSGAMPFAQNHYPFEVKKIDFPGDYISEGIDQTRGWFYTLLAIAVLLDKERSYKNVISLGLILDKYAQKMSKSKGNVVNPWDMISKYGADVVRWYFYTVNPPGEPKRFDEVDLGKTMRQFFLLAYNSFVFFHTYAKPGLKIKSLTNILDKWILARLNETIALVTKNLNQYEIGDATKAIEDLLGDFSRWYIRRSRRRLQKPESQKDYESASAVLGYVLLELSKLIAPFAPFFAEAMYKSLTSGKKTSVHLEDWPKANLKLIDKKLLGGMEEVRRLASAVLAKRAEVGIKVRQPLQELRIKNQELRNAKELLAILKDEVNVKSIIFDSVIKEDFELDTNLTHELREEGWLRDFIRIVQDLRQDGKFEPKDKIILFIEAPSELRYIFDKNTNFIKREINAKAIEYKKSKKFNIEIETKLNEWPIWLAIEKVK